ncbi:hypothetical protein [Clostridium saccharoperbutylacetonicum]|uniref:hypothetical protein n=1 Tax=Clostridium saccharoperbutylacetonicum TaxID=36745 RepID=UPI000983FD51|nr:hypothetical protein [Clostridium saccharoperbutylacetonicum]AQR95541.1 hypothetical protein CLSAP_28570 [Clostridium saccharoperbutylacetonicum]NSB31401.1 hypothetical protein [Clostridium saccharoperbutylacetonicum]
MNELNCKYILTDDLNNFNKLMDEVDILNDNDYGKAYSIHKTALRQYDRWSYILFQIRVNEGKDIPKNPALKDRIAQILKMIDNAYVSARMVWSKAKDDITGGKY